MRIPKILAVIEKKLATGFEFVFNDTILTVGEFLFSFFTIVASLYYAITNSLPIIPQWSWAAIFGFMLIVGAYNLENVIYLGVEEEDEEEWEEDDEIGED